jgi:hypothetical protein
VAILSGCASTQPTPTTQPTREDFTLRAPAIKLTINPSTGVVTYFGSRFGNKNLLGAGGITSSLVGMEPAEITGEFERVSASEFRFTGVDQNQIAWVKTFMMERDAVRVIYRVTNRRQDAFDAIVYSLADMPDARIKGDNRRLEFETDWARGTMHAQIDDPHFPGESMSPYVMRSDSRRLEPGASMEFVMRWELRMTRHD